MTRWMGRMGVIGAVLLVRGLAVGACAGDCGGDGLVSIDELITGVSIAIGTTPDGQCAAFDADGDGLVAVNELVAAVGNALIGCPFTGEYTAMIDVGDGDLATVHLQIAPDGSATGTLSTASSAAFALHAAALRLTIPLLTLTGTVDLETGAYQLSGSFQGPDGDVPINVSGMLPEHFGTGTIALDIGNDAFDGTIESGNGIPPTATPTPTPTAIPPTPGESCSNGSISLEFSNASGTNSFRDLAPITLGKFSAKIFSGSFGGTGVQCTLSIGDVAVTVQIGAFGTIAAGQSYTFSVDSGLHPFLAYLELPSSNPLATRGWKAHGGTLIIDSIEDGTVHFRVVDAQMVSEPSFSYQTPATGTFTLNATGVSSRIYDP